MSRYGEPMTPAENAELESPSADTTTRFGWDERIRKRGYSIHARPNRGEPVWIRDGITFPHSDVLRRERLE